MFFFFFGGGKQILFWMVWGCLDMCNIYYVYYVCMYTCVFLLESNKHAYPFVLICFVCLPYVFGIGCRQTS